MNTSEEKRELSERNVEMKSMLTRGVDMRETNIQKQENKMNVGSKGYPIAVSEQQFEAVRLEQLTSLNLLNSSGDVLLSAMNSMVPPEGSGRVVGEYTASGIRQIAKSICDVVQTKSNVVKQMYQITRDEF